MLNLSDLKKKYPNSNEVSILYDEYAGKYKDVVLGGVDAVYNRGTAEDVINYLTEANSLLKDNEIANQISNWKRKNEALYLNSTEYVMSREVNLDYEKWEELVDVDGKKYPKQIYPMDKEISFVEYKINGQYGVFCGTVFASKFAIGLTQSDDNFYWNRAKLRIYADDRIIYTMDNINPKMKPTDIKVDIRGAEYLKIEFEYCKGYLSSARYESLVGIGDARVCW